MPSALMSDAPDPVVVDWLNKQAQERVWTTAVTAFEVRFGLACLAEGRRRTALEQAFEALLRDDLSGRVAPVDAAAAEAAGRLAARREAAGRPGDIRDTLIGGIALARRAAVATRNVQHFVDLDVLSP